MNAIFDQIDTMFSDPIIWFGFLAIVCLICIAIEQRGRIKALKEENSKLRKIHRAAP